MLMAAVMAIALMAPVATPTWAGYDGSMPLLCAAATVLECTDSGQCNRRSPRELNVPTFVVAEIAKKTITSIGEPVRSAPIEHMERNSGHLVLQGAQNGRAWSFMIDEETGDLTVTVAGADFGFVIFGSCTTGK